MGRNLLVTFFLLVMASMLAFTSAQVQNPVYCASVSSASNLLAVRPLPRRNEVFREVNGQLEFHPGTGVGGVMYGFQPASMYAYEDMFMVENISGRTLTVWYTLEGVLDEWHRTAGWRQFDRMFTVASEEKAEEWLPGREHGVTIAPADPHGPIHFYFEVPPGYSMGDFTGAFILHAEVPSSGNGGGGDPKPPPPGGPAGGTEPGEEPLVEDGVEPPVIEEFIEEEEPEEAIEEPVVDDFREEEEPPQRGDLPFTGGDEKTMALLGLMLLVSAAWLRRHSS